MKVSVEISMYPLQENYIPRIQDFIDRLNTHHDIKVITNCMSTQIFGEYDTVMKVLAQEIKHAGSENQNVSFAMKLIPKDLSDSL